MEKEKKITQTLGKCQICIPTRTGQPWGREAELVPRTSARKHQVVCECKIRPIQLFYVSYLLNRPLGRQFSETHEKKNQSSLSLSKFHPAIQPEWRWANASPTHYSLMGKKRKEPGQDGTSMERHKISLMTGAPFPESRSILWPLALCRRCPSARPPARRVGSHSGSLQNDVHEHAEDFGFFLPGCALKTAFPSEQAVLRSLASESHEFNAGA